MDLHLDYLALVVQTAAARNRAVAFLGTRGLDYWLSVADLAPDGSQFAVATVVVALELAAAVVAAPA